MYVEAAFRNRGSPCSLGCRVASYAETDIGRVGIRAHARGEHGEMSVARELRKDLLRVIRSLLTAA